MDELEKCEIGVVFSSPVNESKWELIVPKAFVHTTRFSNVFSDCIERQRQMMKRIIALEDMKKVDELEKHLLFGVIVDEGANWRPGMTRHELTQHQIVVVQVDPDRFKGKKLFKQDWTYATQLQSVQTPFSKPLSDTVHAA